MRAAVAEVEMKTGLRVSRRGPRVRCRKALAVRGRQDLH